MVEIAPYWQNCIDGSFVDGGAGRLAVDDPGTGEKLAEQALADAGDVETPFGGYGKSGCGREKGREALRNDVQIKNVAIRLGAN